MPRNVSRVSLELYPNGTTPNAMYWLGESYYATENYQLAGQQFLILLSAILLTTRLQAHCSSWALPNTGWARSTKQSAPLLMLSPNIPAATSRVPPTTRPQLIELGPQHPVSHPPVGAPHGRELLLRGSVRNAHDSM